MRARLPVVVFGVALAVRLANVFDLLGNPFFTHPVIDAAEYDEWARAIRAGDLLSTSKGAFWQAPFYPYFLATLYFLLGGSYLAARIAQAVVGAASAALVFCLARKVAGERAGLLAGLGAALYWPFVFFDAELLPVGLLILLDLLTALLLLRAAEASKLPLRVPGAPGVPGPGAGAAKSRGGRSSGTRAMRPWLAAGAVFGLAVLTRATSLLLLPLVLVWLYVSRDRLGRRGLANAAGAFVVALGLVVGLATLRNLVVAGEPSVVASSGGLNFYIGNNGNYDQTVAVRPGARWTQLLLQGPAGPGVTEEDRSNFFLKRGLRWLVENPGHAVALYAKKMVLFWNNHEIRRNQDPYFFRRYSHFLGPPLLGFAAVGPLGLLGMAVSLRRWRRTLLFYLLFLGHLASVLLFFVCERYRLPAVPYLFIFAAVGFLWLIEQARRRHILPLAGGLALWAAILGLSLSRAYGTGRPEFAREYYELGRIAENAGNYAEAGDRYREAMALDPNDPDFYVHLAIAEVGQGQNSRAEEILQRALAIMPECGDAYYLLGGIYQDRREFARAEEAYRRAMRLNPLGDQAEAFARLGTVLAEQGKTTEAEAAARNALVRDPEHPEAHLLLAHLYAQAGRREDALAEVRRVLRRYPAHPAAQVMLRNLMGRAEGAGP